MSQKEFIGKIKPDINKFIDLIRDNKRHQKGNVIGFKTFDSPIEVIVTSDQLLNFNDIVADIVYYKDFNGNFSTKYVEKELLSLFNKILNNDSQADEYIGELYTNFIDNSNNEWRIIAQLENVIFREKAVFKLIDSTLKSMKPEDLLDCTLKLIEPEDKHINTGSLQRDILRNHYSNWVLSHCIYTDVKAGDQTKAEELAIDNFNLSINLLRLYFPNLDIRVKTPISQSDKKEKNTYEIISTNITKKHAEISIKNDPGNQYLNPDVYEYLLENGISSLSNNNQLEVKIRISDVVKDCLYWYGLALDTSLQSAKLLHYVTILESCLKLKGENTEVSQKIADRCALFLETDFSKRKEISKNIKNIYSLRSTVVHTGSIIGKNSKKISEKLELIELASIYSTHVLKKLIKENNQREEDFEKFIRELDDMKYEERFYVLTIHNSA